MQNKRFFDRFEVVRAPAPHDRAQSLVGARSPSPPPRSGAPDACALRGRGMVSAARAVRCRRTGAHAEACAFADVTTVARDPEVRHVRNALRLLAGGRQAIETIFHTRCGDRRDARPDRMSSADSMRRDPPECRRSASAAAPCRTSRATMHTHSNMFFRF